MKIMSKVKIIRKNSIKNILNEKRLLAKLNNPFIVNMVVSFQDKDNLYLIMDLLLGGDLRYHINRRKKYNEKELKFILSCTILGLDYLHKNNILHKDIKPENLVFDCKGYLHITDLGISKIYHEDNAKENSGTPGYMAPEVLFNKNHGFSVDFFALGVIGYELIMGLRPYNGTDKKELRRDILSRQAKIKEPFIPDGWSENAIDFINGLIQRKAENRLGNKDIMEIKSHPWFKDLNWEDLINQLIDAPFKPPEEGNYNHNLEREKEKIGEETELCYEEIKKREEYSKYFEDYTFNEINLNSNLNTNENNNDDNDKNNQINYKLLNSENIRKIRMKYDMTSKMINKLKEEIIKMSNIKKIINNKEYKIKNNSIINPKLSNNTNNTNNTNIKNKEEENHNNKKNYQSSFRFTKSYLLYNFNKNDKDLRFKQKINIMNNPISSKSDVNINYSSSLNPNLKIKEKRNNRLKFLDKKNNNSSLNDYYFRSIYADRSSIINQKFNKKDRLNFRSTNNFMNYSSKNIEKSKLPIIKSLKKSFSVQNYDKDNMIKKIKIPKVKENQQYRYNINNYYSKFSDIKI